MRGRMESFFLCQKDILSLVPPASSYLFLTCDKPKCPRPRPNLCQANHSQEQQLLVGGHFLPFPTHRGSEERGLSLQKGTLASAGTQPWAHFPPHGPPPLPLLPLKLELFVSLPLDSEKLCHEAHDSAITHGSQDCRPGPAQSKQGVAETRPNLSFSFPEKLLPEIQK